MLFRSFTYIARDAATNSEPAIVTITINPVNDVPVAGEQFLLTDEDSPLPLTLTGTDIENDALTFTLISPPLFGALSGTAPNLTYTPGADFHGTDSLAYIANDGRADSAPATVTIEVLPVNDAPVANSKFVEIDQDIPANIVLTGSDEDGDALRFLIVSPPQHGVLGGTPPNVTYTPTRGFFGSDTLAFVVNDGQVNSSPGTVTIHVTRGESGDFSVEAGPDQVVTTSSALLLGMVVIPTTVTGSVTNALWSKASGPGTVQISNPAALATGVTFAEPGAYNLKLLVSYNG